LKEDQKLDGCSAEHQVEGFLLLLAHPLGAAGTWWGGRTGRIWR
jgi:hypothetical protein